MWQIALIPDVDKRKRLERIEDKLDPFGKVGNLKAIERFAKGKISDQVERGPDVPFEQVDCFIARAFDSLT